MDNWPVLGRLKRAVEKVRFLLSFNIQRWRLASVIGRKRPRRVSFNDRRPSGLMACDDDDYSAGTVRRTTSCPATAEDDVDKRAEMFISNFYRQLRIERQISLELKYCSRGNSFGSVSPSP